MFTLVGRQPDKFCLWVGAAWCSDNNSHSPRAISRYCIVAKVELVLPLKQNSSQQSQWERTQLGALTNANNV